MLFISSMSEFVQYAIVPVGKEIVGVIDNLSSVILFVAILSVLRYPVVIVLASCVCDYNANSL